MSRYSLLEIELRNEIKLGLHLMSDALCLHLSGSLQLLGKALRREAFGINLTDAVANEREVFRYDWRTFREKIEETLFVALDMGEFGHDFYLCALHLRELGLYIKGTDGVNLIAEEVDTERIFAAVGIDIEDASTYGKLARFIDIIGFFEFEIAQGMNHIGLGNLLAYSQFQNPFIQILLSHNEFCQCIGISDNQEMPSRREARQHLGTQDFICSITLPVFHGTPITGREEEDLLLPNHLSEIVIKIACFIGIIQYEEHRTSHLSLQRSKEHRSRRAQQALEKNGMNRLLPHQIKEGIRLWRTPVCFFYLLDFHPSTD